MKRNVTADAARLEKLAVIERKILNMTVFDFLGLLLKEMGATIQSIETRQWEKTVKENAALILAMQPGEREKYVGVIALRMSAYVTFMMAQEIGRTGQEDSVEERGTLH